MRAEVTELFLSSALGLKGGKGYQRVLERGHLGRILEPLVKGHSWLEGDGIEREGARE